VTQPDGPEMLHDGLAEDPCPWRPSACICVHIARRGAGSDEPL